MRQHNIPGESAARVPANVGKATVYPPPSLRNKGGSRGFGVTMESRSSFHSTIFRSVPPRLLCYTFTDILDDYPPQGKARSKTAPVSTNSPEDYVHRFKSRPTTRPNVVEFDGNNFRLNAINKRGGVNGFSPPVKLRVLPIPHSKSKYVELPDLQLRPSGSNTFWQKSRSGHLSSRSDRSSKVKKPCAHKRVKSSVSEKESQQGRPDIPVHESSKKLSEKIPVDTDILRDNADAAIVYPNVLADPADYQDLACLPPPKQVQPRRDAPWVYRFKVKKTMNALSKIMASKPNETANSNPQLTWE